jgi:hypothetical protein
MKTSLFNGSTLRQAARALRAYSAREGPES